jgi:YVTN family beta-propeller protein
VTVAPPRTVAGVELYPVPKTVVRACRLAQKQSEVALLCPSRLPRALRDSAGSSAVPPEAPSPGAIPARRSDSTHRHPVAGLTFGYSGETGDPSQDGPERFLHFELLRREEPLPPGARAAKLGGRSGLLAPATSRDYGSETYWANHVRFFWTQSGVKYAATLHDFGPDTVKVLGALIEGLQPAKELRPSRRAGSARGVKTIPVSVHGPVSIAIAGGQIWVAGQGTYGSFADPDESQRPSLVRLDPSGRIAAKPLQIHFAAGAVAITVGGEVLWVTHRAPESRPLRALDPATGRLLTSFAGRPDTVAVAVGPDYVWVVDLAGWPGGRSYRGGLVRRAGTGAKRFSASIRVGSAPAGIAVASGGVWVSNELDDTVTRIDPRTNRAVATIGVGDGPIGVTATKDAIWVANGNDGTVSRVDPRSNRVAETVKVGRRPRGLAPGHGSVWVTNELDDSVSRIDPKTNKVSETIPVGAGPAGLAYGEGALWVANNLDQTVSRIEP